MGGKGIADNWDAKQIDDIVENMSTEDLDEMEKVISTLIEAERLNSGHEGINIERVSIAEIAEKLITDFFSREKHLIEFDLPDGMYLNADKVRVILMIKNLINNALKYNNDKKAAVKIEFSVSPNATIVKVFDSGPGFTEEEPKFFGEPFYRGDPSRPRHTGGTGLGPLSYTHLRAHENYS